MSKVKERFTSEELSEDLDISRIYSYGLYNPVYSSGDEISSERTFESLNGDLGKSNFSPEAAQDLTAECFKVGTFARGYFYGFNFPDRYHKSQFDQDPLKLKNDDNKTSKRYFVSSYSLSANIFVPYSSVVYISYQGFFCGETLKKRDDVREGLDSTHKYKGNRFVHRLYIDDKEIPSMVSSAPSSKSYADGADNSPNEYRWRWQNRTKCVYLNKGYHNIELFVNGILPIKAGLVPSGREDGTPDKLQHRCGSISVLAIKTAQNVSTSLTPTWQYLSVNNGGSKTLEYDSDGFVIIVPPIYLDDEIPPLEGVGPIDPEIDLGTGAGDLVEDSPWPPPPGTFTDPDAPTVLKIDDMLVPFSFD